MKYLHTSHRFLVFPFFQLSLNQCVCSAGVKHKRYKLTTASNLNPRAVGVPEQQPEPRLQVANIAQTLIFGIAYRFENTGNDYSLIIDHSAKGSLTQSLGLFTVIPCMPNTFRHKGYGSQFW